MTPTPRRRPPMSHTEHMQVARSVVTLALEYELGERPGPVVITNAIGDVPDEEMANVAACVGEITARLLAVVAERLVDGDARELWRVAVAEMSSRDE